MSTTTIGIVIAAIVAVLLIVALVVAVATARRRRRERHAEEIREQARLETTKVEGVKRWRRNSRKGAGAAQAEAEVKAAEAARLQDRAANYQSEATTSREQLRDQWDRADNLDPKARADSRETGDRTASDRDATWSEEQATDAEIPRQRHVR